VSHRIVIERRAQKESVKIPQDLRAALDKAILALSSDPRPRNAKKLTDKEGYRIRLGDYRILYTIDDEAKVVVIYRIKIRGESTYK
jgi:mRNA interferase RelE/StbE